jgi:formylmethanofuran dehydrogenase subunit E
VHNMPHTEESRLKMSQSHLGIPQYHKRRPAKIINGTEYYRCGKCGEYFSKDGFYKNKRTILGITSECRKCHCETSIKSRDKDNARDKNRVFMRKHRAENIELHRERERQQFRPKDEKYYARKELNAALKRGDITRPSACEECGRDVKLTAHHGDYSKPLEVRWLCYECHGKLHRKIS